MHQRQICFKRKTRNQDGFGVFDVLEIIQIISSRTVTTLRKHSSGVFLVGTAAAMPRGYLSSAAKINRPHKNVRSVKILFEELISLSYKNAVRYREYREYRVISCDIVALSCDFVRYREYREYRCVKCCTKFAPTHWGI